MLVGRKKILEISLTPKGGENLKKMFKQKERQQSGTYMVE